MGPEVAVGAAVKAAIVPALGAVPFYDYVPAAERIATPFAALGLMATERQPDRCGRTWDIAFRIHLFFKNTGRDDVWNLLHAVRSAIDGVPLALAEPYTCDVRPREMRSADQNDRLQAFDQAFITFTVTVSSPS